MVEKWADYLISAVQYNAAETHIVKVMTHVDNGDSVGSGYEQLRQTVIQQIEAGSTYATITKGADGKWLRGAEVEIVSIDSVKYIKTVPDKTKKDNLGELPRF